MYTNFAAGTLIVLGILLSVLGFLAGASVTFVLIGLGSVATGGILGLLERRVTR